LFKRCCPCFIFSLSTLTADQRSIITLDALSEIRSGVAKPSRRPAQRAFPPCAVACLPAIDGVASKAAIAAESQSGRYKGARISVRHALILLKQRKYGVG